MTQEQPSSQVCEQQRGRPACASAQSDQRLCYSLLGKYLLHLLGVKFQFSVAEETGLSLGLSETLKTGFVATRPTYEYSTVFQKKLITE